MERPPVVRTGQWTNYDQSSGKTQYTTTDSWSAFCQLTIGVLVGAAWPWITRIILRICHWIRYWFKAGRLQPNGRPQQREDESTPLLQRPTGQASRSTTPTQAQIASAQASSWKRNRAQATHVLVAVLALAFAIGSSFVTQLPEDTSGLAYSRECGSWSVRLDSVKEAMDKEDLLQAARERRAAEYGRDCYGTRSVTNPDRCSFFEKPQIDFSTHGTQHCPFDDPDFCEDRDGAIKFTTGRTDASVIGINSPNPPKFSRTTVCTPLNITKPPKDYVVKINDDPHNPKYAYDLGAVEGPRHQDKYTFRTKGWAFKWDVPGYSLSVYESTPPLQNHSTSPVDRRDYWTPRQELNRLENTSLSVMFIASCRIFYEDKSKDVVFPASREYNHEAHPGLYFNSDARARPLACVDYSEVCTHDERICLPAFEETPIRGREGAEYEFVRLAMRKSNTFHSIHYGLGSALNASSLIADLISKKPLDGDCSQWMIESRSLFRTSLARIQFDALDIAMGIGSEDGHYQNDTAPWADLCGKYKFTLPKGYQNINKTATILTLLIPVVLLFLHIETPVEFEEEKKRFFDGNWLVLDGAMVWMLGKFKDNRPSPSNAPQQQNFRHPQTSSSSSPQANRIVQMPQESGTSTSTSVSVGISGAATSLNMSSQTPQPTQQPQNTPNSAITPQIPTP